MKKTLLVSILIALCLCLCLIFVSCGGNTEQDTETRPSSTQGSQSAGSSIQDSTGDSSDETEGDDNAEGGLLYELNSEGSSYAVKGNGKKVPNECVIPSTYNGLPVTIIGEHAFDNCTSLTSITIPDSVTSIGYGAFEDCTSLTSLSIGNGVTSIENFAFDNCPIKEAIIPTVACGIFFGSDTLEKVTITSGDCIERRAFEDCKNLTSVTIAESVTKIGEKAFFSCDSLTDIVLPNNVVSVEAEAFRKCSSLNNITLPSGLTSISARLFSECTNLRSVTIPNSVTGIGNYAFTGCKNLTSITIPSSVNAIGNSAFMNCNKLLEVYNLSELEINMGEEANGYVGYYALNIHTSDKQKSCQWVSEDGFKYHLFYLIDYVGDKTEITLPDDAVMYKYAFCGSKLEKVTIPSGVTSISKFAFEDCTYLTEITISDSVISVGGNAFSGCDQLNYNEHDNALYLGNGDNPYLILVKAKETTISSCVIHESTKVIGDDAFIWCGKLASTTIPNGVISIGEDAFRCTGLSSIVIPNGVTSIGWGAFYQCKKLTDVIIGNGLTDIGEKAFFECPIKNATVPAAACLSVRVGAYKTLERVVVTSGEHIENNSFYGCSNLSSVTLPNEVKSIGEYAFRDCTSLTSITIPASVTSIGNNAFSGCNRLVEIEMANSVKTIGEFAFSGCSKLVSIEIPDSVISIDDGAFSHCTSLTSVVLPSNLTRIPRIIFRECTNLTSITIPYGVTSIGSQAFNGCTGLTSIVVPESVKTIGDSAFYNCTNVTSICILGDDVDIWGTAFQDCPIKEATIPATVISDIPKGCLEKVVVNGGKVIASYGFEGCTSLTSVIILNGVTGMNMSVFSGCTSLTSIVIPSSVTSIGEYAFRDCTSLTIYCEAENQPSGWNSYWNPSNRPVVWGYVIEDDDQGGDDSGNQGDNEGGTSGGTDVKLDIVGSEITKEQWEAMRNTDNFTVKGTSTNGQYENEYIVNSDSAYMKVGPMTMYYEEVGGVPYTIMYVENFGMIGMQTDPIDTTIQGMLLSIEMDADTFDLMTFNSEKGCYVYEFKDATIQGGITDQKRSGTYEFYFVDGIIAAMVLIDDENVEPQIVYLTDVGTTGEVEIPAYTVMG